MSDPNGKLKKAVIKYKISEDYYDAYNSLRISNCNAKEGDSVKFSIYRTLVSTDSSQIFQRKRRADGTYYGVKRFDSRTSAGLMPMEFIIIMSLIRLQQMTRESICLFITYQARGMMRRMYPRHFLR